MKRCNTCKEVKPLDAYWNYKRNSDGKAHRCIECEKAYVKQYRARQRYLVQGYRLRDKYGITREEYQEMLEDQDNLCAICKQPEKQKDLPLAVDHCHETQKVRGLLCSLCNMGIGLFRDDPAILRSAIQYLANREA